MKDSTGFVYDDLRVIGGNPGNANQDGMDWLGGGDAIVRDSFLRASDDVFAMQGNWDGYTDEEMLRPGHDVQNILIEHSELSTSISNIVRAGWPRKTFNSRNFTLRDSDILHGGIGACGQTFGLFGFWGANGAKGDPLRFTFENLFLDNWYSLAQMEQEYPGLQGFTFRNIWALDQPPLADSTMTGDVADVTFDNVKYGQTRAASDADLPLVVSAAALQPAHFTAPPQPGGGVYRGPAGLCAGRDSHLHRATLARRALYLALRRRNSSPAAAACAIAFRTPREPSWTGRQTARPLPGSASRGGYATDSQDWAAQGVVAVAHWHDAASIAGPTLARPRLADLSRRMDRTAEPCRRARGLHRRRAQPAAPMRRALRITPLPGTASSTFPPTAATPFTCWLAMARGW